MKGNSQLASEPISTGSTAVSALDGQAYGEEADPGAGAAQGNAPAVSRQTVFHGAVRLDPVRAGKEFQQLADEIFVNLQTDGELELIVAIRATSADGFADGTVRTVTENSRVLKFNPGSGFESE